MKSNSNQNNISQQHKEKFKKIWKFDLTGDFYLDLRNKESSDRHTITSSSGSYLGLYQIGEGALIDTKYYVKPTKETKQWEGIWLGKNGINSKQDFLDNRQTQEVATREYHKIVWRYLKDYQKYEGSEIGGIKLSKAGMIACGHLVGHGGMKNFINSNGITDDKDGNGTPCSQYLEAFSEHVDVDFTVEGYLKTLPKEKTDKYGLNEGINSIQEDLSKLALEKK